MRAALRQAPGGGVGCIQTATWTTPPPNWQKYNVTINGDSGISNDGTLSLGGPSSITGDLDLGRGAKTSKFDGTVGGTISSNQDCRP